MTCTFFNVEAVPARFPHRDNFIATLERAGKFQETFEDRWLAGITFVPHSCGGGGIYLNNCINEGEDCDFKVFSGLKPEVRWRGYTMFASVSCSTFGDRMIVEREALNNFTVSRPAIAAWELYYGHASSLNLDCEEFDGNPYLATTAQGFPTAPDGITAADAVAVSPKEAAYLALNEIDQINGVLHVTYGVLLAWAEAGIIERNGQGNFETIVGGHLVIPGYPGSDPIADPVPPFDKTVGVDWVFATGDVFGYRGTQVNDQTLDHRRNNYFTLVEQSYLIGFDPSCPRFGIPVEISSVGGESGFAPVEFQPANDQLACDGDSTPFDPDTFIGIEFPDVSP